MPKLIDYDRLAQLHREGRSAREIATILGCTERSVSRWRTVTGHNVRPASTPYPPSVRERAARLIEDGCSLEETGRTLGIWPATIARWFPDAPRMTHAERAEWAAYCKKHGKVLAGTS